MKYRKKPVIVEAILWDGSKESAQEINKWNGGQLWDIKDDRRMYIPTIEGHLWASPGDYIIKGVQGEFYPCKPDIFEATYEQAPTKQETADKLDPAQVVQEPATYDISEKPEPELSQGEGEEITVKDVLLYELEQKQRDDNFDEEYDRIKAKQDETKKEPKVLERRLESPHPKQILMCEEPVLNPYIQSLALSSASLASAVIKDMIALELVKRYLGVSA